MKLSGQIKSLVGNLLPPGSFLRNVSLLAGGTSIAQALSVLALPVITRLYSPEDFNTLAVVSAIIGILSVVMCLRFEIAIPLPEDDLEAANLAVLGILFTTIITLVVIILVFIFAEDISNRLGQPELKLYLWFIPAVLWFTGLFSCFQYWATRTQNFTEIAKIRVVQSLSVVATQVGVAWLFKTGSLGLLLAQLSGVVTGFLLLGRKVFTPFNLYLPQINPKSLKRTFLKYSNFPKYSTFESLVNSLGIELPIIIIAAVSISAEAGFALLAMKIMAIPVGLIGGSISQVYLSRASDELRANTLDKYTIKILVGLVGVGVGPLLFIGILAPELLSLALGSEWSRTGVIVAWMTPWFIFQFLSSPISMVLHVTSNQQVALFNQLWGVTLRVGLTVLAAVYLSEYTVEVYALTGVLFYSGYLLIVLRVSGVKVVNLFRALFNPFLIVGLWLLIACLLKLLMLS